ncbi:MAG TPA: hypothetical protein VEH57_04415 [Thermoplasmata archaeon]|nr:hypothetical protein [Thermoplasmata archaeon]
MASPPNLPPPAFPESVLVHGTDEASVNAVAVGMALRFHGSFAWADCAPPVDGQMSVARRICAKGSRLPDLGPVAAEVLKPPKWSSTSLRRLVAPESTEGEERLTGFLALPELFQELVARSSAMDGRSAILLANVDALAPALRERVVEPRDYHDELHREGVSFFASSRRRPTQGLVRAFDRVLSVYVPPASDRWEGLVSVEKGLTSGADARPCRLRDVWALLGLDPDLLAA